MAIFHYNALMTLARMVYLDTSECLTYIVCHENIEPVSLLGKSPISALAFFVHCFERKTDAVVRSQGH